MSIRFGCPHCGAIAHVADEHAGRIASCVCCGNLMTVPHETNLEAAPSARDDEVMYIDGRTSRSWGRILLALIGVGLCLMLLIALFLPAVERAGPAARRMSCSNNLKQLALAMHNYHDVHGCLPPAYTTDENGRPMHCWRVFLLPYFEQQRLYEQYDFEEPWDSPNNLEVFRQMPPTLRCPSANMEPGYTNYVVVIGDPDKFPQTMFTPDRSISLEDVTDGPSNTLLIVETRRAVPWTMPGADLHFDRMTFRINGGPTSISSAHPQIAQVARADGSVYPLDDWLREETLRNLIQPADGNPVDDY